MKQTVRSKQARGTAKKAPNTLIRIRKISNKISAPSPNATILNSTSQSWRKKHLKRKSKSKPGPCYQGGKDTLLFDLINIYIQYVRSKYKNIINLNVLIKTRVVLFSSHFRLLS